MSGFVPQWPAPAAVGAYITERQGGASAAPYASNNVALHVGDDPARVAQNRARLQEHLVLPAAPQWLEQVHGTAIIEAGTDGFTRRADGAFARSRGGVCAVLTADCLPVLLCDRRGTQVAAIHCGWRGLAAGILAKAVALFDAPGKDLLAYLGPAISQRHYPVGDEVRAALAKSFTAPTSCWIPEPGRPGYWLVDLYAVAGAQLRELGVAEIHGAGDCTYSDEARFYSYRRDGVTGRMASVIWLR